jgi:DUF1680 family protein
MAVCGLISLTALAKHHDKIALTEEPVRIVDVRNVGGFIGNRMQLNRDVYLKNFPIDRYVDFIVERQHTSWYWGKAEQHGKWIESAYLSALESGDKELMAKVKKELYRIIDSQESNGYVGATAKAYRSSIRPIRGMDPYELYFFFHALITVYEESGDSKALKSAERLANYFLCNFGPGKNEFWPSSLRYPENKWKVLAGTSQFAGHSVHYGWEGTLLADPICRLYEVTGKNKYLNWTKWVVSNIDRWGGWDAFSRLDSVASGAIGIDKLQPYVHAHTFHMNFMGFLRLYRATGNKSLLRKVVGAWNDIYNRQMYITGGVSVAEHYEHDYVKPLSGNIIETCATMSWMQLTQMLLQLTGDTKYADAMERLMLNHVFAAQDAETGTCRYHTAPNGSKPDGYFHGPDCCTASGHRIISLLPTFFYAQNGNDFYINQYVNADYTGKGFDFSITGNYPEEDNFVITITSKSPIEKTLNLRIPAWCDSPKVAVNGKQIADVVPGSYLKLSRRWAQGDKISIAFPMREQWVMRQHHSEYHSYLLEGGEIMYKEEPAKDVPYAFMRGPIIYCMDMVWNKQIGNDDLDFNKDLRIDVSVKPQRTAVTPNAMGPFFRTKAMYKGSKVDVNLVPFANIGQWYRLGEPKPQHSADAFTYAIWMYKD